jgi:hypothetical protein
MYSIGGTMSKWYTITGTFEYLVQADDSADAIEKSEEDFLNLGLSIISVDTVKEY